MHRRELLRRLAAAGAGAASTRWIERLVAAADAHRPGRRPAAAAATQATAWTPRALTAHQNETVATISELVIPQTETPGARAARVNEFIDAVIDDADEADRRAFLEGLDWIDARSQELFGARFVDAAPEQQTALLTIISSEHNTALDDRIGVGFFAAMKSLTVTGYYLSEIGMREELGDDGSLFFQDDPGCTHPGHQKS